MVEKCSNSSSTTGNTHILFIPGKIEHLLIGAILCDTGSHVSLISHQIITKLDLASFVQTSSIAPRTMNLSIPISREIFLTVTIGQPLRSRAPPYKAVKPDKLFFIANQLYVDPNSQFVDRNFSPDPVGPIDNAIRC